MMHYFMNFSKIISYISSYRSFLLIKFISVNNVFDNTLFLEKN